MKIIVKALNKVVDGEVHGAEGVIQFRASNGEIVHTETFSGKINFDPVYPYSRQVEVGKYTLAIGACDGNFDWEIVE